MKKRRNAAAAGNLVLGVSGSQDRIVLVNGGKVIGFVGVGPESGPTKLVFDFDESVGIFRDKVFKSLKLRKEDKGNG